EGVSATSFKVVEAESRVAIAQHILNHLHEWERFLRPTSLWWDLSYYPYKYSRPRGWTAEDLLARLDATHVDGDSSYQLRVHEIPEVERLSGQRPAQELTSVPTV
ncbi:MAG: hypothetical protein L0191_03690, partial [Acidobacteria bacterium]|nr:hypothetical protein [Acidobacteriota bacterium]